MEPVEKIKGSGQASSLPFTPDIRKAPGDVLACCCSGVGKDEILEAKESRARSLDEIKAATGAGTEGRYRETNPRRR